MVCAYFTLPHGLKEGQDLVPTAPAGCEQLLGLPTHQQITVVLEKLAFWIKNGCAWFAAGGNMLFGV